MARVTSLSGTDSGSERHCVGIAAGLCRQADVRQSDACKVDCKLRTLIEKAGDVIWTVDMSMQPTYISPSIQRHLGYTVKEAKALSMEEVFTPHSYTHAMQLLARELTLDGDHRADPERSRLLEVDMVHKDGRHVPFEIHCSALRDGQGTPLEIVAVARDITARRAAEEYREASTRKTLEALEQTVRSLAVLSEMRDSYTAEHQRRVAGLASAIGSRIGMQDYALQGLRLAGLIHDIGKVRVPAEILTRPGGLSAAEVDIIRMHPAVGYDVLSGIDFPWSIAEAVYQHHERIDGSGYPRFLTAEEIVPEAKILAVADVVEAIASDRPYRPALGTGAALQEISSNRSILYDAEVVDACLQVFSEGYCL